MLLLLLPETRVQVVLRLTDIGDVGRFQTTVLALLFVGGIY